ncbi:MAG: response regulator transcription factor [Anaerolineales bacterium]|nr:response regulator transcription factor [Anaerolineales bacterium]MCB8962950.1 response regulator transcription factor [Ardenticatenales bacterium]
MIRVLICDDQDVVRKGLQIILSHSEGLEVIGQAVNGLDGVQQALAQKPDVVLMDLKMPELNGIHATRRIRHALPETRVVILTTFDGDEWVFDAIRAGASGYILKDADGEEIVQAIRDAAEGKARLDSQIAGKILTAFNNIEPQKRSADPNDPLLEELTEREMSILRLMAQGKSNADIAAELFLANGTVKNNVSNIMSKFHANDRTQAVLSALRRGIVELD